MQMLLVSSDLMMISAAQGAADRHGVALAICSRLDDAVEVAGTALALVVIDLRTPGLDVRDAVEHIRRRYGAAKIAACGPHVHKQSLQAAEDAGCDEVLTRGEFERRLDQLLIQFTTAARG